MRNFILSIGGVYLALMALMFAIGAFSTGSNDSHDVINEGEPAEVVFAAAPAPTLQSLSLPVVAKGDDEEAVEAEAVTVTEEEAVESIAEVPAQAEDDEESDETEPVVSEVYREFISEEMLNLGRFRESLMDPVALSNDSRRLASFFAQYSSSRSYLVSIHNDLDPAIQPFNLALIETYASAQDIVGYMMSAQLQEFSSRSVTRLENSVNDFSEDWDVMIDELRETNIIQ